MSKDFSPEAESVVISLRNAVNQLIKDIGCKEWIADKELMSVTANFSGNRLKHHLGILPFEVLLFNYGEALNKLESLLSANVSATGN